MEILNKNIEAALGELDASDENKRILKSILYKYLRKFISHTFSDGLPHI